MRRIKDRVYIKDLTANMGNFTLYARITEKSEAFSSSGKKSHYALIEDRTGRVKINLQENQVNQVKVGRRVRIKGTFTEVNEKHLEVYSYKDIESYDT
jgi:hypothetical protein